MTPQVLILLWIPNTALQELSLSTMICGFSLLLATLTAASAYAAPQRRAAPTVTLDDATVVGSISALGTTNQFLGLRFAQPVYAILVGLL